jgi:hypothetical protein
MKKIYSRILLSLICFNFVVSKFLDAHYEASIYLSQEKNPYDSENINSVYSFGIPYSLKIKYVYDTDAIAYAMYDERLFSTGWDFLTISSYTKNDEKYSDNLKAYATGFLEAYLTANRIWNHFLNTKQYYFKSENIPNNLIEFIQANKAWITQQSKDNSQDDFWYQVSISQMQLEGMIDGYNSISQNKLTYAEFSLINASNEVGEISKYYKTSHITDFDSLSFKEMENYINKSNHCSVLVKIAADFSNVFFGHNTWLNFSSMTRIFKEIRLVTNKQMSYSSVFSSYPGNISSNDDFYITDTDLYISETTHSIFNESLYKKLQPESVMTWQRAVVANRLSLSGPDWVKIISKFNSGTLNNQWQIFDMKKFDGSLQDNALTIIEMIPGYFEWQDSTGYLRFGYWPSYNIPFFEKVRELSGYDDIVVKKPELKENLQYWTCARANIFRRDENKVKDIETMKNLMRYNDWNGDIFSKGSPCNTLACRKDLDKENPNCMGATDAKFSSWKNAKGKGKSLFIISGPTTDIQIPFNTKLSQCIKSKSADQFAFYGLPDEFNFKWIEYKTKLF